MIKVRFSKKILIGCFLLLCAMIGGFWYYYDHALKWKFFERKIEKAFSVHPKAEANIAFVSWELSRTGEPVMLARLAKMLKENNYNVAVLHKEWPDLKKEIESEGIPVMTASITEDTYDQYMNILKKYFDLAIVCDDNITLEYSMISEVLPTIWWLHETALWPESNKKVHYPPREKPNVPHFEQFVNPLEAFYFADIVTVSAYAKKSMTNYVRKPVEVITNGISQEEIDDSLQEGQSALYHELMKRKEKKTMFLQIGRISKIKGQRVLLEAIKLLPAEYQDKAIFYIIGQASDEFATQLMEQYKDVKNVIWTGELKRKDVNDHYRAADVLLHPSTKDDAAPNVIAEAAMYHMPSVMTDRVGSDYIVKDGDSGFVIKHLDVHALRDKIIWLIDHPKDVRRMGKKAYQNFVKTSTPDKFFSLWKKKIDSRLQEQKKSSEK